MAGTFGTLRRDSYFSPGEVAEEMKAFDAAIKLLAKARFNSDATFSDTDMAAWNSFVSRWNDFLAEAKGPLGVVFRSKNATRDELLNFEDEYATFRAATEKAAPGATNVIPFPKQTNERSEDNIRKAAQEVKDAAKPLEWTAIKWLAIGVGGYFLLQSLPKAANIGAQKKGNASIDFKKVALIAGIGFIAIESMKGKA